jgi:adenine-specific DNA-methyltransferase
MADELDGLLGRVEDSALRADLRAHIDRLRAKRTFGLVFESHLPERVRLPEHPVRAGAKVALRDDAGSATYQVVSVREGTATIRKVRHSDGSKLSAEESVATEDEHRDVDELVVVANFGEPIYPGLRRLGSVDRGGDKPAHVVIKGENHHVLEALQFTHAGKVDCIYIDPPYNTGARDWKYDNNYVDDSDAYRHSKWLAFMERRLLLAKDLLKPDDSMLVVAIDEKEYLRLGLLLQQTFPGCDVQMVTVITNRAGSPRSGRFARVEEYLFVVFVGSASVSQWTSTMLVDEPSGGSSAMPNVWFSAMRVGTGSALREARPALFYPVLLDVDSGALHSVGEPLEPEAALKDYVAPPGTIAMWPLSTDGREQTWRFSRVRMREYFEAGTARLGRSDPTSGMRPITYLRPGTLKNIEDGVFEVHGRTAEGALDIGLAAGAAKPVAPASVWNRSSHYARDHGSKLNERLVPGRQFPYPKSLYAVEDTIRFAIAGKPNASVLDFFAGSGTTTHAVARLNRQDGGRRQSIVVTNNEVSAAEAEALRRAGLRPGDPEWEALGIFEHITRPRITAALTGLTPEDEPVKGDYKFTDEFPMAEGFQENVEFVELTYQDPDDVELDLAFEAIASLLWMRAGGVGPVIETCVDSDGQTEPFAWTERYGVLFDADRWRGFVDELPGTATTAFVVTDSQATFAGISAELPDHLDVVRLYENYLTTFRINEGLG